MKSWKHCSSNTSSNKIIPQPCTKNKVLQHPKETFQLNRKKSSFKIQQLLTVKLIITHTKADTELLKSIPNWNRHQLEYEETNQKRILRQIESWGL